MNDKMATDSGIELRDGPAAKARITVSPGHADTKIEMRIAGSDGVMRPLSLETVVRMVELLRECSKWYVGDNPDGTGRRDTVDALLAEIDGEPSSRP